MLVQSPSRIYKADFAVWKKENSCIINEMILNESNSKLSKVTEIVLNENGNYDLGYKENCNLLIIVLYGEVIMNDFEKPISAEQVFTLKSNENNSLTIKNNLPKEKSDILIFEFKNENSENYFSIEDLNISEKNALLQISNNLDIPNFIGLYDGRKEQEYSLYKKGNSIFGMVINGAFEFQNRLLENRDAVTLTEVETLEFEALSENALIVFFEI